MARDSLYMCSCLIITVCVSSALLTTAFSHPPQQKDSAAATPRHAQIFVAVRRAQTANGPRQRHAERRTLIVLLPCALPAAAAASLAAQRKGAFGKGDVELLVAPALARGDCAIHAYLQYAAAKRDAHAILDATRLQREPLLIGCSSGAILLGSCQSWSHLEESRVCK